VSVLLSHIHSSINAREAARALHEAGDLHSYHTRFAITAKPPWMEDLFPKDFLQRQVASGVPQHKIVCHPWFEMGLQLSRRLPWPSLKQAFSTSKANSWFDQRIANYLSHSKGVRTVYSYFDIALHTFRAAKKQGLKTFYELPTPHWPFTLEMIRRSNAQYPEWAATMPTEDSMIQAAAQRDEELALADHIIVPSELVKQSLLDDPKVKAPIHVIPYGCPTYRVQTPITKEKTTPFKLLFAGTMAQSKGLADLLSAISRCGSSVELSLAGSRQLLPVVAATIDAVRAQGVMIHQLGKLTHPDLMRAMHGCDAFILPTLYEGLSLALLEALSAGKPVITTVHSGLKGWGGDEKQIILLPVLSPDAIFKAIQDIKSRRHEISFATPDLHSWSDYREALVNQIQLCA
jgi:alpha-maltose-1-phosphate synthase